MAIDVNSPIQFQPVKSKRFLCGDCLEYLIEWTPVMKAGMGRIYFEEQRRRGGLQGAFPKVRMECPRGHHRKPYWTFFDSAARNPGRNPVKKLV